MAKTLLVHNGTVITLGERNRVLEGHSVLCEGDRIARIAPAAELAGRWDEVVDARGKVVMPGFINAHTHLYSTFARGLAKAEPAHDFRQVLERLWWRLDSKLTLEDSHVGALVALIECIESGTTTVIDHHASPFAARGSLARIAEAVELSGVRACLAYEVSDRDGEAVATAGLEENADFIASLRRRPHPRLAACFGLHASFTLGDRTLDRAASLAGDHGFHVHVAEARSDQDETVRRHGLRVVERLAAHGLLGPRSIAAHGVHLDAHEMDLLAQTGTALVHNPQSNANNAVGVADVLELVRRGVLVGLGTDAMTVAMGEEARVALWLRHLHERDSSAGFLETLGTLLGANARIASRYFDPAVGVLAPGWAADLVLLDYNPPTPLDETSFLGHFAYGLARARVDTTVVGGRVLMAAGRLRLDLDRVELAARARELARALWERF